MAAGRPFRFAVQGVNAASGAEWREMARRAEGSGYSALHLADHYLGPGSVATEGGHSAQVLAPVPAMAFAAAATETLRIGCRVFCVDYHLPAVLAKEAATLDLLSDGRLELGLGAGWVEDEYKAMGVPFDPAPVRIERLAEVVALLKDYFAGTDLEHDGSHVHVHGYRGTPEPVQRPRPPLMIGGGAKRVLSLAGREADIVSLNFDNRSGRVGADSLRSATAEATDEKIGWIRAAAADRFDAIELEVAAYFTVVTDDAEATATGLGSRFGLSAEEMREHPNALIGPVPEICERLQARRERFGISYITVSDRNLDAFAPVVAELAGR